MRPEEKKKDYSLGNNLRYIFGQMWRASRWHTTLILLKAPFGVGVSFLAIALSRAVVEAVTNGVPPETLLIELLLFSLGLFLAIGGNQYLITQLERFMMMMDLRFQELISEKCMAADYQLMESAQGLNRMSKALDFTSVDQSGGRQLANVISSIATCLMGIGFYGFLLAQLSPWILLVLSATTVGCFFLRKACAKWTYHNKDTWKGSERKLNYIKNNSKDFTRAKDLRLYAMSQWFDQLFSLVLGERMALHKKEQRLWFAGDLVQMLLTLLREGVAYGGLVYLLLMRGLPVADFVLYFGIIGGFSTWLTEITVSFEGLMNMHYALSDLRTYLEYPDLSNRGKGMPLPTGPFSITFEQVSFRYPGAQQDTLHDLSFHIEKGEKLAIVGCNGAGKTTLIKVLCGLYQPTSGKVLLDGKPLQAYNLRELFTVFAPVFQEIFLLPRSIACNVAAAKEVDLEKAEEMLKLAGLWERVMRMPQRMDTVLVKSVYPEAVDLSGGEVQKLGLARALYKGGHALLLDEPTAALDPIAESTIYEEYYRMTQGKTAVFISHRLASTRFCHRIFFLEQGSIAEVGSHEQLMEEKGKYYFMFDLQSHYYKKEVGEDDTEGTASCDPAGI